MFKRKLVTFAAVAGLALLASAQPPATAPYVQPLPISAAQTGGIDPYATVAPESRIWIPGVPIAVPTLIPTQERLWWRAEYLIWWTDGMDLPPLVTSSPPATPEAEAGVLGLPDTTVLFGNQDINSGSTGGVRLMSGIWLTADRRIGVESELFRLRNQDDGYAADGDGAPILARPYFNIVTGAEDSRLISFPGAATGSVRIRSKHKLESYLIAGRVGLIPVSNWQCEACERPRRADFSVGYRRLKLEDNLHFADAVTVIGGPVDSTSITEHFATKNKFDGLQLGFTYQSDYARARLETRMRVAVGNNRQTINIGGSDVVTNGLVTDTFASGLLAQPTNSGNRTRDAFTMIPELGATLGLRLTNRIYGTVGYTILYFPNVVRAGDQIDTDVNPTQFAGGVLVGAPRPRARFVENDYWAHGLNLGAELRF